MKTAKIAVHVCGMLVAAAATTSCVTMQTYRLTKAELLRSQYQNETLIAEAEQLREQREALEAQFGAMMAELGEEGRNHAELQALLRERTRALEEVRALLSEALQDFSAQGLSVMERNGTVYVSMDEKLLFELGKAEVSPEGERAIRRAAEVLARNPNIRITVEGHTDNLPYRSKPEDQILDNWDLSVHRATAVIRILTDGSGIAPQRITAAGRSQYVPVAANHTAESRQLNRRTEIILTPDMDRLMELLDQATRIVE